MQGVYLNMSKQYTWCDGTLTCTHHQKKNKKDIIKLKYIIRGSDNLILVQQDVASLHFKFIEKNISNKNEKLLTLTKTH